MERKIGESFEFLGYTLKVKENKSANCNSCFFAEHGLRCGNRKIDTLTGRCLERSDGKDVVFIECE